MSNLRTDYKDDVFSGNRKYVMANNNDGTVTLADATVYTQQGDYIGAEDINAICRKVNENADLAAQAFQSASEGKQKIATAITGKGVATSSSDTFQKMADNINAIETDKTGDATAIESDLVHGKTAYVKGVKITGTRDHNPNLIAGSAHIECDQYVMGKYSPDGANRIYIRPSAMATNETSFSKDTHFSKKVSELDYNLVSGNIVSGKSILGVNGTATPVEDLWNFPLTISPTRPTGVNNSHIWVEGVASSITKVVIVDSVKASVENGTLMIVVGSLASRVEYSTADKSLTDGSKKTFLVESYTASHGWRVQNHGVHQEYLNNPIMIYTKIGGVLDVATAQRYNGSAWVQISQKGSYILRGVNIKNLTGDNVGSTTVAATGDSTATFSGDGTYVRTKTKIMKRNGDVFTDYFTLPNTDFSYNSKSYVLSLQNAKLSKDGSTLVIGGNVLNNSIDDILIVYKNNGSTFVHSTTIPNPQLSSNLSPELVYFTVNDDGSAIAMRIQHASESRYVYDVWVFIRNTSGAYVAMQAPIPSLGSYYGYSGNTAGMTFIGNKLYVIGKHTTSSGSSGDEAVLIFTVNTGALSVAYTKKLIITNSYSGLAYTKSATGLIILGYSSAPMAIYNDEFYTVSSSVSIPYMAYCYINLACNRMYIGDNNKTIIASITINTTSKTITIAEVKTLTDVSGQNYPSVCPW